MILSHTRVPDLCIYLDQREECVYMLPLQVFAVLALLILQFMENLSRMLRIADFYISSPINISSPFIQKTDADIYIHQEFIFSRVFPWITYYQPIKLIRILMIALDKNTSFMCCWNLCIQFNQLGQKLNARDHQLDLQDVSWFLAFDPW